MRFSTTTDPKYTFEVKYDSSKKSYVCYSNKELRFTVTGAEHAANYLIELLHKSYKGVRTEFRTPYLNQTAKDALIWYTADGFNDTTETLRDKASGGSVSFGQWLKSIFRICSRAKTQEQSTCTLIMHNRSFWNKRFSKPSIPT